MLEYIVSIENSADSIIDIAEEMLSPDTTQQIFTGVLHNAIYTVSVTAVNGVGSSVTDATIGKKCTCIMHLMELEFIFSYSDCTCSFVLCIYMYMYVYYDYDMIQIVLSISLPCA